MNAAVGDQEALAEALAAAAQDAAASLDRASLGGEELERELKARTQDLEAAIEKARALKPAAADGLAKERRLEATARSAEGRAEVQGRQVEKLQAKLDGVAGPGGDAERRRVQADLKAARCALMTL